MTLCILKDWKVSLLKYTELWRYQHMYKYVTSVRMLCVGRLVP